MQIEAIRNTELTQSERDVLREDTSRWQRMGAGSHLDDWLAYQPGLMIRRRLALRLAFVNAPEGKGYAMAFRQLMQADGLDHMDGTSISALLWLGDQAERMQILREMREAMNPGRRSRLNSPITARKLVEKALAARQGGTEASVRTSPVAQLQATVVAHERTIAARDRTIAALEQRLARADEGQFDLQRDTAENIAIALVGHSRTKAKDIANKVLAKLQPGVR